MLGALAKRRAPFASLSGSFPERVLSRLVRTIKGSTRFAQCGRQRRPRLATCLIKPPKLFFRLGSIGIHALHDHLDFRPTLRSEVFSSDAKLVSRIAPSLRLSVSLSLEDRLLLLDLLAKALDIFLDLTLEGAPLSF